MSLVKVNSVLVEQALGQVLENAAKYSSIVSTIRISTSVDQDRVVLSVTDQGVGLTQEKKQQGEQSFRGTRHRVRGARLGLWIADTFVTMWAAAWQARVSWRVYIGLTGSGRETASPAGGPPCTRRATARADAWRQHHVAVFMALALFDPDHLALAVDVGHLQRHHFGHPLSGPIGHTQGHLVFEPRRRIEKPRHLLRTEDHRKLAGLVDELGVVHDVGAPERDLEKVPQRHLPDWPRRAL
jgi:Histidine kinase-, DNA gyrase B-, and HSP90-like ATPase